MDDLLERRDPMDLPEPGHGGGEDLTTALPESLTVSIDIPATVHTLPEDEAIVAIDDIAISPVFDGDSPTTTSIDVVPDVVHALDEEAVVDDVEQAEVPPLPGDEDAVLYTRRGRGPR